MSAHPYRQKAAPAAPYPVYDESMSESRLSYHTASPLDENTQLNKTSESENSESKNSESKISESKDPVPSPRFTARDGYAAHPENSRDSVVSPPQNSLSATSSIPNLNLGVLVSSIMLPKDGVAGSNHRHNRSVSLSLSLFYDRENPSIADFNQNVLQLYLGLNLSQLMPRMKTIEMYRKNAKKLSDPAVLFQYAQYMLQTALMLDSATSSPATSGANTPQQLPLRGSALQVNLEKNHRKLKSANSLTLETDVHLKRNLLKEALHYLKRLSDKGYVEAQYLLGDAYSSGAFGKIDNREAFVLFLAAAKHGHTESAFRTAHCYEEGLGTGRDARKGVEFLKMAASKNHAAAMYKLGVYSFNTRMGLPDNVLTKKLGIKWLERALNVATELTAAAPYELGKIYFDGFLDILLQDKKYALELYAQAAALGHVESSAILGHHYEVGDTVPEDPNLSIHYYTKAALGGHPESMLSMCAWYLVGSDPYLPKDDQEAFEWAKRAALCGLAKAQFALANFYDKGIGCVQNLDEAQTWYVKAAENGEQKALARISNKDTAARLAKVSKKARKQTGSGAQEKDCIIM